MGFSADLKGFVSGFKTGIDIGNSIEDRQLRAKEIEERKHANDPNYMTPEQREIYERTRIRPIAKSDAGGSTGAGGTFGDKELDAAAKGIRTIESGSADGNYSAKGPQTKSGDRAYGAYQVMGANIPQWTAKHFGKQLTPDEFLANREAQDAVFKGEFGGYMKQYGAEGAAKAWFGGPGAVTKGAEGRKDVLGTSVGGYGSRFGKLYATYLGDAPTIAGGVTDKPAAAGTAQGGATTTTNPTTVDAGRTKGVSTWLTDVANDALKANPGLFVVNPETEQVRTPEQQAEYKRKGWSQTDKSYHLAGNALDLIPVNPATGKPDKDYKEGFAKINAAMQTAAQNRGVKNLEWGGNWKGFNDPGHFQLAGTSKTYSPGGAGGATAATQPLPPKRPAAKTAALDTGAIPAPAVAPGAPVPTQTASLDGLPPRDPLLEEDDTMAPPVTFARTGGAIPVPTQRFATGGKVKKAAPKKTARPVKRGNAPAPSNEELTLGTAANANSVDYYDWLDENTKRRAAGLDEVAAPSEFRERPVYVQAMNADPRHTAGMISGSGRAYDVPTGQGGRMTKVYKNAYTPGRVTLPGGGTTTEEALTAQWKKDYDEYQNELETNRRNAIARSMQQGGAGGQIGPTFTAAGGTDPLGNKVSNPGGSWYAGPVPGKGGPGAIPDDVGTFHSSGSRAGTVWNTTDYGRDPFGQWGDTAAPTLDRFGADPNAQAQQAQGQQGGTPTGGSWQNFGGTQGAGGSYYPPVAGPGSVQPGQKQKGAGGGPGYMSGEASMYAQPLAVSDQWNPSTGSSQQLATMPAGTGGRYTTPFSFYGMEEGGSVPEPQGAIPDGWHYVQGGRVRGFLRGGAVDTQAFFEGGPVDGRPFYAAGGEISAPPVAAGMRRIGPNDQYIDVPEKLRGAELEKYLDEKFRIAKEAGARDAERLKQSPQYRTAGAATPQPPGQSGRPAVAPSPTAPVYGMGPGGSEAQHGDVEMQNAARQRLQQRGGVYAQGLTQGDLDRARSDPSRYGPYFPSGGGAPGAGGPATTGSTHPLPPKRPGDVTTTGGVRTIKESRTKDDVPQPYPEDPKGPGWPRNVDPDRMKRDQLPEDPTVPPYLRRGAIPGPAEPRAVTAMGDYGGPYPEPEYAGTPPNAPPGESPVYSPPIDAPTPAAINAPAFRQKPGTGAEAPQPPPELPVPTTRDTATVPSSLQERPTQDDVERRRAAARGLPSPSLTLPSIRRGRPAGAQPSPPSEQGVGGGTYEQQYGRPNPPSPTLRLPSIPTAPRGGRVTPGGPQGLGGGEELPGPPRPTTTTRAAPTPNNQPPPPPGMRYALNAKGQITLVPIDTPFFNGGMVGRYADGGGVDEDSTYGATAAYEGGVQRGELPAPTSPMPGGAIPAPGGAPAAGAPAAPAAQAPAAAAPKPRPQGDSGYYQKPSREEIAQLNKTGLDEIQAMIRGQGTDQQQAAGPGPAIGADPRQAVAGNAYGSNTMGPTPAEMNQLYKTVDPEGKLSTEEVQLKAMQDLHDFWVSQGDMNKAKTAAANVMLYGKKVASTSGAMALSALQDGDVLRAAQWLSQGYAYIPNGESVRFEHNPADPTKITYWRVGPDGEKTQEAQTVGTREIQDMAVAMANGSGWLAETMTAAHGGRGGGARPKGPGYEERTREENKGYLTELNTAGQELEKARESKDPAAIKAAEDKFRSVYRSSLTNPSLAPSMKPIVETYMPELTAKPEKPEKLSDKEQEAERERQAEEKEVQTAREKLDKETDPEKKKLLQVDLDFVPINRQYDRAVAAQKRAVPAAMIDKSIPQELKQNRANVRSLVEGVLRANNVTPATAYEFVRAATSPNGGAQLQNGKLSLPGLGTVIVNRDIVDRMKDFYDVRKAGKFDLPAAAQDVGDATDTED